MAIQEISKTDERLLRIYETQFITPEATIKEEDKSETLFAQMNFIAVNNMSFLKIR